MKYRCYLSLATIAVVVVSAIAVPPLAAQELNPPGDVEGVETLTRGPLHEAFAEPLTDARETLVVAKEPPAPIDEVPPEYRPDDDDASWIAGYWAWDEERDDFLWVSGVWRVPPPGQRWVPGYWQTASAGWEWVPGFWVADAQKELVYRAEVPATLEAGPTSPSPGDDYFYIPGCWNYTETGYRWQPGYWHECYDNWIWVPARWCWTPRGMVFINGYWDFRLAYRGTVFAPVYFQRTVWTQPRFVYRPSIVLNVNVVFNHLFVRPGYRHYYFGDWYGDRYARYNILPAYQWHTRRGCYDPMVSFYTASYRRRGEDFIAMSRDRYRDFERHEDRRPAHTYREAQRRIDHLPDQQARTAARVDTIAARLDDVVRDDRQGPTGFVKLEDRRSQLARERNDQLRELARQRNERERSDVNRGQRPDRPDRLALPEAPNTRPDSTPRTERNRPGRDDVPRPIARSPRPDGERGGRPDVATSPHREVERPEPRADRPQLPGREGRPATGTRPDGIGATRPEIGRRSDATDRPETGRRPAVEPPKTSPRERPQVDVRPTLPDRGVPQLERGPGNARRPELPKVERQPSERNPASTPRVDNDAAARAASAKAAVERARAERAAAQDRTARERSNPAQAEPRRTLRPEVPGVDRGAAQQRDAQEQAQRAQREQQRNAQQQAERAAQAQRQAKEQAQRAQRDQQRAAQQQTERAQREQQRRSPPQLNQQPRQERGNPGNSPERGPRGRDRERGKDKD